MTLKALKIMDHQCLIILLPSKSIDSKTEDKEKWTKWKIQIAK